MDRRPAGPSLSEKVLLGASSEKPMTGAQKRKAKKVKAQQPERDTTLRDALRSGELVEIDGVRVGVRAG